VNVLFVFEGCKYKRFSITEIGFTKLKGLSFRHGVVSVYLRWTGREYLYCWTRM